MKKAQVTLFVILGIIIVSALLVFFFIVKPKISSTNVPRTGFSGCVEDAVEQTISELSKTTGFINPKFSYKFKDEQYPYLCYTKEYYKLCTVQVPFLKQYFEKNLEKAVEKKINSCYLNSLEDLKSRGYNVVQGDVNYSISLGLSKVFISIDAPTTTGHQRFKRINIKMNSPIYEMLMIATTILQYESGYGDSDLDSLRNYYPQYSIVKLKQSDGTTLYAIEDKQSKIKLHFASRSLAWPPGYG